MRGGSLIFDAVISADINHLLHRAAESVSAALFADHVLVRELNATNTDSYYRASIGWDPTTSARLGTILDGWSRQPGLGELKEIPTSQAQTPGKVYIPSSAFLQQQELSAGLFATVSCGESSLTAFAGCSAARSILGKTDAQFLHAIMSVMGLTIERAHDELVRSRDLRQVGQAKRQWESALDALPELICVIDRDGRVLRANRTLETWNLGEVTSIKGTQVHDMLHPGCSDWNCPLMTRCEKMWQQFASREFVEFDYQDNSIGRSLHCFLCRSGKSQYRDGAEKEGYSLLVIEDTSLRKYMDHILVDYVTELENLVQERAQQLKIGNTRLENEVEDHLLDKEALRESEKNYTVLMEPTLTGFYIMQDKRIVFCNSRFANIFGYIREEIYRLDLLRLFPSSAPDGKTSPNGDMERLCEYQVMRGITKDGNTIWLNRILTRSDSLRETITLGNIIDVTAQIKAEIALECLQCEKKALSEKLLLVEEAERKRIASELHDGVGQSISAIKCLMENALRNYAEILPQSICGTLTAAVGHLGDTIEEVRKISMDLSPLMLDDLGLLPTISWSCREFKACFPELEIDVRTGVAEGEVPDSLKIEIFRILQEALNNVGKHAMASKVSIELAKERDRVTLIIGDDGQGFAAEDISTGQGFGLHSMRARAKRSGGNLAIESAPGAGTLIRADWPVGQ